MTSNGLLLLSLPLFGFDFISTQLGICSGLLYAI